MNSSGAVLATAVTTPSLDQLAWSPDSRSIVVVARLHPTVTVIDAETGRERWNVPKAAWTVAIAPDGRSLAAGAHEFEGGTVWLLDFESGEQRWLLERLAPDHLAFSPDGRLLAITRFESGLIRLVDARTGAALSAVQATGRIGSPVFSADSRSIVATERTRIFAVDTQTGATLWELATEAPVTHLALDDQGRQAVAVFAPSTVRTLDAQSGAVLSDATLEGPFPALAEDSWAFVQSPDRRRLLKVGELAMGLYATADGSRRVEPRPLPENFSPGRRVQFSPDARLVAVTALIAQREGVIVADADTGATVWEQSPTLPPGTLYASSGIAFSPDGGRLAHMGILHGTGGPGFVHVYHTGTHRSRHLHGGPVTKIAATAGGIRLLATTSADHTASVFHADSGELLLDRVHPGVLTSIAFTPDGQCFATASSDGGVRLYETVSGLRLWLMSHGAPVNALAFAPDGSAVATASTDKTARLLNRNSGKERWRRVHPQGVTLVAVSPDGRTVATACADRSTRILSASTGEQLFGFQRDGKVRSIAFSPVGSVVASGNEDGSVLLVDSETGQTRGEILHPRAVSAVAVSPDGALLASGGADNTVRLTDLGADTPVLLAQLSFAAPISQLAFHPLGRRLAIVTDDQVVRVVDPSGDGVELARFVHPGAVRDAVFTRDGELLATACEDGYARAFSGR
jgi:WD40 repeat protein